MKLISLLIFLTQFQLYMAQEVNSKAYDLMLSGLLSNSVERIDVKEAKEKNTAVFVDSREEKEYKVSHIKDAIWVGYDDVDLNKLDHVSKSEEVIVYCSVGYRSEKIAEQLIEKGYTNVKNLYGGIFEWVNQDGEVEDSSSKKTNRVHAYNRMWGIWLDKGEKVY